MKLRRFGAAYRAPKPLADGAAFSFAALRERCRDRSLFFFWGMMAQRLDKYLPNRTGARPLSTSVSRGL